MNRAAMFCLWLLRLPARKRLALALGVAAASLGLYGLAFPATSLGGALILPLVLAGWLFGWRGGLICLAGLTLALAAGYELAFGWLFWSSSWLVPCVIGTLSGLVLCLAVGALHHLTDDLLNARRSLARTEQAYQQEHGLNCLKDQALQNLAHELRTPLTQIDGYLELLETYRNEIDSVTQARFIANARSGCEELLNIITMTQNAAWPSDKPPSFQMSNFSLLHEVQTALAHCEPHLLQEHLIELAITEALWAHADARCVRLIMRNLLTNACKYTPAGTRVVVNAAPMSVADEAHGRADMICVRVRDQGPGIAPEHRERIFQRFVRLPQATASAQPGSGLGLSICKQLVEAMGGAIWVESAGPDGKGCCFCFTLASGSPAGAVVWTQNEREEHDETQAIAQRQPRERAFSTSR